MFELISYDEEDKVSEYLVYDVKTCILNSIRRLIYSEYKNYIFDPETMISTVNTSLLHNELIAHRLQMIPLNTTKDFTVSLKAINNTKKLKNIYSDDLMCDGDDYFQKQILLLQLKPGQEVSLEISTKEGCGKENVAFRPVSTCYFKNVKEVFVPEGTSLEDIQKYKDLLDPYTLLERPEIQSKNSIGFVCDLKEPYIFKRKNNLELEFKDMRYNNNPVYLFSIESFFMNPDTILKNTFEIFRENIKNFMDMDIEVDVTGKEVSLTIPDKSPTFCNVLSWFLREDDRISYALYNKAHPLDDFILLRIILKDESSDFVPIVKDIIEEITKYISIY